MTLSFKDIRHQLHVKVNAEFKVFPVGGHNMNGTVNKKIREMKGSVLKSLENERKLLLPWETPASKIGNTVKSLPISLRKLIPQFENINQQTPNQSCLGRKNDQSPIGTMTLLKTQKKL